MPVPATAAAKAYAATAKSLDKVAPKPTAPGETQDFGALVKTSLEGAMEAGKAADAKVADLAAGKASLVDVVTAVAETEVAIETLVSVRDRMITAYEEILQMPI